MDDKCTPLKHKYDQCFNLWFEEYLGLESKLSASTSSSTTARSSSADSSQSRFSSFFGSDRHADPSATDASTVDARRRNELRVKYDSCAQLFEDYKTCVRAAVRERDLEPLIQEARQFNPFPFPSSTAGGASEQERTKYGNFPFPFPQDPKASGNI